MNQANKPPVSDTTLPSPVVEQDGDSVILSFDEVSVQSRMRLDDPTALDLDYSRVMMAFLLIQPQPASILNPRDINYSKAWKARPVSNAIISARRIINVSCSIMFSLVGFAA